MSARSIRLPVPFHAQPYDSDDCAAASLQMILGYDGRPRPRKVLAKALGISSRTWPTPPRIGTELIKLGYAVRLIVARRDQGFPTPSRSPEEASAALRPRGQSRAEREWLRFTEAGGTFVRRPVRDTDLDESLSHRRPVLLMVWSEVLWQSDHDPCCHAVVITGASPSRFVVHDPFPRFGGIVRHERERVMAACDAIGSMAIFAEPRQ